MSAGFIEVRDWAWNTRGTEVINQGTGNVGISCGGFADLEHFFFFLVMEAAVVGIDADSCRLNCQ